MMAFFVWYAICGVVVSAAIRFYEGHPAPVAVHLLCALTWPIWVIEIAVRLGAWCAVKFYKFLNIEI